MDRGPWAVTAARAIAVGRVRASRRRDVGWAPCVRMRVRARRSDSSIWRAGKTEGGARASHGECVRGGRGYLAVSGYGLPELSARCNAEGRHNSSCVGGATAWFVVRVRRDDIMYCVRT